ncbi:Hypothetical protein (Fragment), partial [Durusdinium trenchii]
SSHPTHGPVRANDTGERMAGIEVRIDAVDVAHVPKDTYVSMRVGDYQKQSRFGSAKTYRFPHTEDQRFARLEVFHRVGHLTVNLDNLSGPVEVPVELAETNYLPMNLCVLQDGSKDGVPAKVRAKGKVDAAQKYLAEHHVEEVIADAIREVIHEKPADPCSFLSAQILKHASIKKPQLEIVQQGAPSAPPEVPFKDYYASNVRTLHADDLQGLYSKFPAQPIPPSKPLGRGTAPAEMTTSTAIPFTMKPSVGTWLMAPPKMKSESPNLAAVAPVEIIEEAPMEASVPVIAKPPETSLTPFKDYYASHVRALHPADMQN